MYSRQENDGNTMLQVVSHQSAILGGPWIVESEARSSHITAQVQQCQWPTPNRARLFSDMHRLVLTLTPLPSYRTACLCPDDVPQKYLEVGDIVFIPAGVPLHSLGAGGPQRSVCVSFDADHIDELLGATELWTNEQLERCLDIRSLPAKQSLIWLTREVEQPGFASNALIESLSNTAILSAARSVMCNTESTSHASLPGWQLRRIKEYVAESSGPPPTVQELAATCGLSRRHLSRLFREATGETVQSYIEAVRFEKAKLLLKDKETPIKHIAHRLGFSSVSAFSTAFTRRSGVSPAKFRSEQRLLSLPAGQLLNS